jgi:site-specific DNA recombinase
VRRPVLDELEERMQRHELDVIVVLNEDRLSRDADHRSYFYYVADRFGCEIRFAELEPDGKLPQSGEDKLVGDIRRRLGRIERDRIVKRTRRGRVHRASLGLPSGGRDGPPYGFRKAQPGEPYSYWMEAEAETTILRRMLSAPPPMRTPADARLLLS